MKLQYNSEVQTYHCSTCVEYIYFYQNCKDSVVLISKSAQVCTILVRIKDEKKDAAAKDAAALARKCPYRYCCKHVKD